MHSVNSAAVQNRGNRIPTSNGNGCKSRSRAISSVRSIPAGRDANPPVVPPESLRRQGRWLCVPSVWLQSYCGIPGDVLGDALDEVRSWGVEIDSSEGIWFDRRLFEYVLMHPGVADRVSPSRKQGVLAVLEPKP